MKRRPSLVLLLIVLVAFFGLGFLQVMLRPDQDAAPAAPTETPVPGSGNSDSPIQILVIGVDDLGARSPALRALWMATYTPAKAELFLFGLPLDLRPSEQSKPLADRFSLTRQGLPAEPFLRALQSRIDLQPALVVVLDEHAFARAVDFFDGVEISGVRYTGEAIMRLMEPLQDEPRPLLEAQIKVLQSLLPKALGLSPPAEVSELMALLPDHMRLSTQPQEAFAILAPMLDLEAQNVHVLPLFIQNP